MRCRTHALAIALGAVLAGPVHATEEFSTDITVDLGGTVAADEDVVEDTGTGAPTKIDIGSIPQAADVIGYSVDVDHTILFSLDIPASLPGGIYVTPQDVVRWNGSVYSIAFKGSDHGVPAGAEVDAIAVVKEDGDLLLSFDVTVALGSITADDEDLVRLESTQPDVWSLYFDGSAEGVPPAADLDGADRIDSNGHLELSFDISGSVGGVDFDDDDILEFDPGSHTWTKRYDGSTVHPELAAADIDAIFSPEPGASALGIATLGSLAALRARRASA